MPSATIQSNLDAIIAQQSRNEFGTNRYALLFKPGPYSLDINVGFYTQVLGLGKSPDDVTINGSLHSEGRPPRYAALVNFTRAAENLAVVPENGNPVTWAVSQGTSLRRVGADAILFLGVGMADVIKVTFVLSLPGAVKLREASRIAAGLSGI